MYVSAIIAAAGRGTRLGGGVPKPFLELGGRTLLDRSLAAFLASDRVHEVVVVVAPDRVDETRARLPAAARPVRVVGGGARRQDSVAHGFDAVDDRAEVVVVHDAARPFVTGAIIERTIEAAVAYGAAVAALRARDTVKQAREADGGPIVTSTLPRETIYLVQTPQAFRREVLAAAVALGRSLDATDEAALAERAGYQVRLVEGDARNFKVTTDEDLTLARRLIEGEAAAGERRMGVGYDLHRLVDGRPLVLGGVTIPFARGLAGHSDADAVCHALTDAVLGAAAAGDIGRHFPDTDARWKGASSLDLLRCAAEIVRRAGFAIENVDAVVIAERPTLVPHLPAMIAHLASALGIEPARVSVKGKTNEGVGEIGRGEAIAVHAVALLTRT